MIDKPDFSPVWNNLGKVEAISILGIPTRDAQNARDMEMGMPKTRGYPYHCDTGSISPSVIQRVWKGLSRIVCYLHYYICTRGGEGGYSGFKLTGMIEWGQKSKPKKIPWAQQKQKKIPGLKISPQKISRRISGP